MGGPPSESAQDVRPATDGARFAIALGGIGLFLAYPFVFVAGNTTLHNYRCAGRTFTGTFDDCFNDMLPIDLFAFPLTLLLLYPFARFAFAAFAPAPQQRSKGWRLAGRGAGRDYSPLMQILAGVGILWAFLHVKTFPAASVFLPFFAYWAGWLSWFVLAMLFSWPWSSSRSR